MGVGLWLGTGLGGAWGVAGDGLLAHLRFEAIGELKRSFVARVERVDLLDGDLHWNGAENLRELEIQVVPQVYALDQNFPNPFNSVTRLAYQLPRDGKDESGRDVSSGVYVCRLWTEGTIVSRKLVLLR